MRTLRAAALIALAGAATSFSAGCEAIACATIGSACIGGTGLAGPCALGGCPLGGSLLNLDGEGTADPRPWDNGLWWSDEVRLLYAAGVRKGMAAALPSLKIQKTERVWVVNKDGGTNNDSTVDALTYDAIVDLLRNKGISEVVERDDDLHRNHYVEYTESGALEARDRSLAEQGKLLSADVVLAYRVVRLDPKSPGLIIIFFRNIYAGCLGLCADARANNTDGLRMALHVDAIDVKTGTVRTARLWEYTEPQDDWIVQDKVFDKIAY